MNTTDPKPPKPVTAAKVRAVLRKLEYRIKGRTGPGFFVRQWSDRIAVRWASGLEIEAMWVHKCRKDNLQEIAAALTAAGIACEVVGDEVVIRIEPGNGEES